MKFAFLAAAAAIVLSLPAQAQLFGTGSGTFADYLYSAADQSVNFRQPGQVGAGYQTVYNGSSNVVMTQPSGLWSTMVNYGDGAYTVSFDAPNAGAVNVAAGGMFSGLRNQLVTAGHYSAIFDVHHDGGNIKAGGGEIDLTGGITAANPVTNFRVVRQGGNARDLTPLFTAYAGAYQGVRWMNNANVNNNLSNLTAADLLPPGQNIGTYGNSYADQARWTGQIPNDQLLWTNVPVGADTSFVKGMADQIADNLPAGKKVRFEYGNENWNFAFYHPGKVLALAQADPRIGNRDNFTAVAMETGLRTADLFKVFMAEWAAKGRNASDVDAFINSQGANQYFANTAVETVKANYGDTAGIKTRGISLYPADNLSGAGSVDSLIGALYTDLGRQKQYLRNEVAAAQAEGLTPGIYEWSPNGYLTQGGVPLNVITAFRADPRSKQWVLDEYAAIQEVLGPVKGSFAMEFTIEGDLWTPQLDPLASHEFEQQAIDQISATYLTNTPEPASVMLIFALAYSLRRSSYNRVGQR